MGFPCHAFPQTGLQGLNDLREPAGDEENHDDEDQTHEQGPAIRDVAQVVLEDDVDQDPSMGPQKVPSRPRRS